MRVSGGLVRSTGGDVLRPDSAGTGATGNRFSRPESCRSELILTRKGRKVPRALDERRTLPGVEVEEINGQEGLLEISAITPEQTLERIVTWLTENPAGPRVRIDPPSEHMRPSPHIG